MLTPQQIQDKKFEKALFNGYDMGQIDEFLDELLNDYTSLYKENATLKTKMKVLVDKIEEYRAVDEEMRKALYSAQRTSREITEKAQAQADDLVRNARSTAESSMSDLRAQIELEQRRLAEAKKVNAEYVAKIRQVMHNNIEALGAIIERPVQEFAPPPPPKTAPPVDDFVITLPEDVVEEMENIPPKGVQPAADRDMDRQPESRREPPRANVREVREPAHVGAGEMETRFFEIELGGSQPEGEEPVTDTGKLYGSDLFTPKPKYEQNDIRFGKDYDMNEEE